ncbi:MAG: hypothetical protein SH868_03935 [Bythopirellula sp.]|nr:hypothetical protein [Bythopirellula sp.]
MLPFFRLDALRHLLIRVSLVFAVCSVAAFSTRGDDDGGGYIPPLNPGPGYGGVPGGPALPPRYQVDQGTIPYGVQTIYNIGDQTGDTDMWNRQLFQPSGNAIDWVGFVFQNSEQPDDPDYIANNPNTPDDDNLGGGPGTVSISLWANMSHAQNMTQGVLSGLLGTTNQLTIAERSTSWLLFDFPDTISLVPNRDYYLSIDISAGYSVDVAGVHGNISSRYRPYGFWYHQYASLHGYPQSVLTTSNEFLFAEGIITEVEGDHDADGDVDGRDFLAWQRAGGTVPDLQLWQTNYGMAGPLGASFAVPEAASGMLILGFSLLVSGCRGRWGKTVRVIRKF